MAQTPQCGALLIFLSACLGGSSAPFFLRRCCRRVLSFLSLFVRNTRRNMVARGRPESVPGFPVWAGFCLRVCTLSVP